MDTPAIVPADVAFMLVATALVLLMTPALAFFYGGLVRSKNALNTMMMSFISLGFVGVAWALVGYSLAFATGTTVIGDLVAGVPQRASGLEAQGTIPHLLFMSYQGTFAIITAALISGAIVERMRFSAYLVFITLWSLVVYAPVAHWVWGGGWLAKMGALDFAGGTVVHVNAAARRSSPRSWSASARTTRARRSCRTTCRSRCSAPACCGSAGSASTPAARSPPTASPALAFVEHDARPGRHARRLDAARPRAQPARRPPSAPRPAIVVGLVAITPAAGFVEPDDARSRSARSRRSRATSRCCCRARTRLDDSLDVVAAHGVGGTVGALLTGVFAQKAWNGTADGLLFGNPGQLGDPGASASSRRSSTAAS